jgi:hypothetical protein
MPIERSQINSVLRTIKVDYFGNAVAVTYRPDGMTPEKEAELARLQEAYDADNEDAGQQRRLADNAEQLAGRLAELMVSWDITEGGEPLPPTKANLMTFPNALLGHIVTGISEDLSPKVRTPRRF